jgi:asparagine synthase (glutamine-hydrolysing)
MHLSEPHLLAVSNGKTCCKVLLSGEGADELMGGYTRYKALQHPSLLNSIATWQFRFFFKPLHNKLLRVAQIQKIRSRFFNGSNIYQRYCNHFWIENTHKRIPKKIYEEAKSLYPGSFRQALYFDQHTYLCSLLDRNDRCTMGASIE